MSPRRHQVLPVSAGGTPEVSVSRNIVASLNQMPSEAINLILAILDALREYILFGSNQIAPDINLCEIPIPYDLISQRHAPKETINRLKELVGYTVQYHYSIPGIEATIVSGIISAVTNINGFYYVDVAPKAVPWLLYCGQAVGFANAERNVAVRLPIRQRRVYLYMMSFVDRKKNSACSKVSLDQLSAIIGLPTVLKPGRITERVLKPLKKNMKSLQSKFNFEYEMIDEKSDGRGNRAGVGYCLSIVRVDPSSSIDTSVYNYLSQSFKQLAMDKRPLVEPLSVMNLIIDKGKEEDFLDRIRRLKPTDSPLHKARKIAKLLLNEYGIQVYADLNPTLGVKNEGESHTE